MTDLTENKWDDPKCNCRGGKNPATNHDRDLLDPSRVKIGKTGRAVGDELDTHTHTIQHSAEQLTRREERTVAGEVKRANRKKDINQLRGHIHTQ